MLFLTVPSKSKKIAFSVYPKVSDLTNFVVSTSSKPSDLLTLSKFFACAKIAEMTKRFVSFFHEIGHWCEPRLDLTSKGYAFEELVAEIASAFLSAELGIPGGDDLTNHAAYLQSWLLAMKNDIGFIFKASTQASQVVDFILSHQNQAQKQPVAA